jgi:hypothetical protein
MITDYGLLYTTNSLPSLRSFVSIVVVVNVLEVAERNKSWITFKLRMETYKLVNAVGRWVDGLMGVRPSLGDCCLHSKKIKRYSKILNFHFLTFD